jgi:transposase
MSEAIAKPPEPSLEVLLRGGRRIGVRPGFHPGTLQQIDHGLGASLVMFGLGPATKVYLALGATDLRKGFDGLYGLVRDRLLCDPLCGHLFLFANAKRNRLKILYWDGSGLWSCAKRLERGCFSWPSAASPTETKVLLGQEELALLLGGIDLSRTRRKAWYRREEGADNRKAA